MSYLHRKASSPPPPASSDKILAIHMVGKAQKKMTLLPGLICVEHDKGHGCLQIYALVQVSPVPRHDVEVSLIFFSFP